MTKIQETYFIFQFGELVQKPPVLPAQPQKS